MKNRLTLYGGDKRLVSPFMSQEFWKCIGCILSAVTYGNKRHNIWSGIPKTFGKKPPTKLQRDVCGNTDLNKVCWNLYRTFYCYDFHMIILSYTTLFVSWMFLWVLTSLYPYRFLVYH